MVEILRLAGERFAGKTSDRVSLRLPDRMAAACSEDPTEADRRVEETCLAMGWRVDRYPNRWDVTIRNFAKKQGYGGQESDTVSVRRKTRTSASDSDSDSDSDSKSEEKRETAPSAPSRAPKKSRGKAPQVAFPGAMTTEQWTALGLEHSVDPQRLFDLAEAWAGETDRRYAANGWRLAIGRALRDRWSWTTPLFGASGPARRRTYADDVSDQNAETLRQYAADLYAEPDGDEPVPLFAIPGGER